MKKNRPYFYFVKAAVLFMSFAFMFNLALFAADSSSSDEQPGSAQSDDGSCPPLPPQGEGKGGKREMKAPPQAAIEACSGKEEGASCQCQGPNGNESGTCAYTPDKKYFACRPNSMKMRGAKPGEPKKGFSESSE